MKENLFGWQDFVHPYKVFKFCKFSSHYQITLLNDTGLKIVILTCKFKCALSISGNCTAPATMFFDNWLHNQLMQKVHFFNDIKKLNCFVKL